MRFGHGGWSAGWRPALSIGLAVASWLGLLAPAWSQLPVTAPLVPSLLAASAPRPTWIAFPRVNGRLQAADLGLVINASDPMSVEIGEHYIRARGLRLDQVLRVDIPVRATLTRDEFERLRLAIEANFGPTIQALALAWAQPYAVECNSITGALALGFDAELCKNSCAASRPSRYFNSASITPLKDLGWRPSMLLAARNVEQGKALIDRGVAADGSLGWRGRPPVTALLLQTDDAARRVRRVLYPPAGLLARQGVDVRVEPEAALQTAKRLLMVSTGSVRVNLTPPPDWVPGGFGDHLTSYGGDLFGNHGHSTALGWLDAGATASHGTVSEPCNHLQKFPHPQVMLGHYLQGATLIEAYWKSVAWPQQSLFVGEPLAAPFAVPIPAPSPGR